MAVESLFCCLLSKERAMGVRFLPGKTDGSATEKPEPFSKR